MTKGTREGHGLCYTSDMRSQAVSFESSSTKTPNDMHTTTNSCHILTESHRRSKHRQLVTPYDIHTPTSSSCGGQI